MITPANPHQEKMRQICLSTECIFLTLIKRIEGEKSIA